MLALLAFRSLFSPKYSVEWVLKRQEALYRRLERAHPDWEPHLLLCTVWQSRARASGRADASDPLGLEALTATIPFACMPPPLNVRAMGLSSIGPEKLAAAAASLTVYVQSILPEVEAAMGAVHDAVRTGTLPALYGLLNPRSAEKPEMQDLIQYTLNSVYGPRAAGS